MQNRFRILVGIVAISSFTACSKPDADATAGGGTTAATPAASTDRTADAAAIVAADSAWLRHVMAKNVDSIMTYYSPDAVSYGFGPPASGADKIRANYTEMVKATLTNPQMTTSPVTFSDDGTMAFDHGTYSFTMQAPGGPATKESGVFVNVWKKIDGQWKIIAEVGAPTPKA